MPCFIVVFSNFISLESFAAAAGGQAVRGPAHVGLCCRGPCGSVGAAAAFTVSQSQAGMPGER